MKGVGVLPCHAKPPRSAGKGNRLKEKKCVCMYVCTSLHPQKAPTKAFGPSPPSIAAKGVIYIYIFQPTASTRIARWLGMGGQNTHPFHTHHTRHFHSFPLKPYEGCTSQDIPSISTSSYSVHPSYRTGRHFLILYILLQFTLSFTHILASSTS